MLRLCGERLTPKVMDHATANMVFCVHLRILKDLDHQNLIRYSFYHPGPLHRISPKSINNVVHKHTNKLTDKPTLPKT